MNKRYFIFLFTLCFFCASINGQQKYWIKLRNKFATPYSVSNPSAFVTQKAIDRRAMYGITFDDSDLPVNPLYVWNIDTVKNVRVLYASKWLNGVAIQIDSVNKVTDALNAINSFTFVASSNRTLKYRVNIGKPLVIEAPGAMKTSSTSSATDFPRSQYGGSYGQNVQVNAICLHDKGFRGQGITIGVMDVGFINADKGALFDSLRNSGRLLGTRDFVDGGINVFRGGDHGTNVLSCMASLKPGYAIGTAPLANYWLFRTEQSSSETISEEYNWVRAAEFGDSVGVDLFTTSLGYTDFNGDMNNHTYQTLNGRTAPMSIAANLASRKGIFVLNAAGNEGDGSWKYIAVAGDADSICTVGAVDTLGNFATFSGRGPTPDGRIKPDLSATGLNARICNGDVCGYGNGTSFSTPVLAGAVACFWQAHRKFTNMQVLDTLKKYATLTANPNNNLGWGIPDVCRSPIPQPARTDVFSFNAYSPAPGKLIISLSRTEFQSLDIQVCDLLGKVMYEGKADPKSDIVTLTLPYMTDGIYVVKVNSAVGAGIKKMVKQGL